MTEEWLDLCRRLTATQRMLDQLKVADAIHGGPTVDEERVYTLQRADVAQAYRDYVQQHGTADDLAMAEADARATATRLRDLDIEHDTTRGSVPASDDRWQGDIGAQSYVRQEAAAAQLRR